MGNYSEIKGRASAKYKTKGAGRYADGGRVPMAEKRSAGGKTTVNIVVPPAPPGPPAGAMPPAPPPPPPGPPPGGPGMPPAGAAAMSAMGAPPPGAFKAGGRVKGGAAGGKGRLAKIGSAERMNKRSGGKVC